MAASQMCSQGPMVHFIASKQTFSEAKSIRAAFKSHQEVVVMKDDLGVSCGQLIRSVKQRGTATDDSRRLEDCRALTVQGNLSCQCAHRAFTIWAQVLWELPEKVMKFTLNAVQDTLPHNANLHMEKATFSQLRLLL